MIIDTPGNRPSSTFNLQEAASWGAINDDINVCQFQLATYIQSTEHEEAKKQYTERTRP